MNYKLRNTKLYNTARVCVPVVLCNTKIWHCNGLQRSRRLRPSPWPPSEGHYAEAGEHSSIEIASNDSHFPLHGTHRCL